MATRKELLEELDDSIDVLTDTLDDQGMVYEAASYRMSDAADRLSVVVNGHAIELNNVATSVKSAGSDIRDGLIVGAVLTIAGGVITAFANGISMAVQASMEALLDLRKRNEMISSIDTLSETHPRITYGLAVERSYAYNSDREERMNLLNGLIRDGIAEYYFVRGEEYVRLVEDAVKEHYERVDRVVTALEGRPSA